VVAVTQKSFIGIAYHIICSYCCHV